MIGLGRAVTLESASPDAITRVRRAWEATPASSLEEGAPSPILVASFAVRSPARSVAFVPALTLIDEAGARWAITAGIGDAPDPLAAVSEAVAAARPTARVPESLTFGQGRCRGPSGATRCARWRRACARARPTRPSWRVT